MILEMFSDFFFEVHYKLYVEISLYMHHFACEFAYQCKDNFSQMT